MHTLGLFGYVKTVEALEQHLQVLHIQKEQQKMFLRFDDLGRKLLAISHHITDIPVMLKEKLTVRFWPDTEACVLNLRPLLLDCKASRQCSKCTGPCGHEGDCGHQYLRWAFYLARLKAVPVMFQACPGLSERPGRFVQLLQESAHEAMFQLTTVTCPRTYIVMRQKPKINAERLLAGAKDVGEALKQIVELEPGAEKISALVLPH